MCDNKKFYGFVHNFDGLKGKFSYFLKIIYKIYYSRRYSSSKVLFLDSRSYCTKLPYTRSTNYNISLVRPLWNKCKVYLNKVIHCILLLHITSLWSNKGKLVRNIFLKTLGENGSKRSDLCWGSIWKVFTGIWKCTRGINEDQV